MGVRAAIEGRGGGVWCNEKSANADRGMRTGQGGMGKGRQSSSFDTPPVSACTEPVQTAAVGSFPK